MRMIRLRCPSCKNVMNYQPLHDAAGKSKRCVYCGKSFSVIKNKA